jgi:hypothetical protein
MEGMREEEIGVYLSSRREEAGSKEFHRCEITR